LAWLGLASVATSGLAILAVDSGYSWLAVALLALALCLYGLMTGLVIWRACHDPSAPELRHSDIWILMGGIAIATLAGDHIRKAGVEAIGPVTVVTWVLASLDTTAGRGERQAPSGQLVDGRIPVGDVLFGVLCERSRNRLAVADHAVAGVLLDRLGGVGPHSIAISA
jgi:hypothetical protein